MKLISIEKGKAELVCQAIKISTKLMTKINSSLIYYDNDCLQRIKLLLKFTRIILIKAKDIINESDGQKSEFFKMYINV